MVRPLINSFLLIAIVIFPVKALAAVTVSPLLIDRSVEERETLSETITLTNTTSKHLRLYASVHEITIDEDTQIQAFVPAAVSDRTTAITSWLEISRGRIEIAPGESRQVPLTIRINPAVKPGQYHGLVGFAAASNRDEAEALVLAGKGVGVVIRIGIDEEQTEFLRLSSFKTDRFVLDPESATLSYTIDNTGEAPLTPEGNIIFYDTKGQEVGAIPINEEQISLAAGESKVFTEPLSMKASIGRYKAYLAVEYGEKLRASAYDTIFFYLIPTPYLVAIFAFLFILILSTLFLVRRHNSATDHHEEYGSPVALYVRDGVSEEKEHDLNLKKNDT